MKKSLILLIFFIIFTAFLTDAITYNEKIKNEKNKMEKDFKEFFSSFVNADFDSDLLKNYINSSNTYLKSFFNKPLFFVDESIRSEFFLNKINIIDDNTFIFSNSNFFRLINKKDGKLYSVYNSRKFDSINYIDIMDSDFDNKKELFIISSEGVFTYIINKDSMELKYREENSHYLNAFYRIKLDREKSGILGKVLDESNFIYNPNKESLYFFEWIFPGFDRKEKVIEEDLYNKNLNFYDLNNDMYSDFICIFEEKGRIVFRVYLNDRKNRFDALPDFFLEKKGFVDCVIKDDIIYIMVYDGIYRAKFEMGNLIIDKNFFNIDGCLAFDVLKKDELIVFSANGNIEFLKRLE